MFTKRQLVKDLEAVIEMKNDTIGYMKAIMDTMERKNTILEDTITVLKKK